MSELAETIIHQRTKPLSRTGLSLVPNILALLTSGKPWSPGAVVGAQLASRLGSVLTGCYINPMLRSFSMLDVALTIDSLMQADVVPETPREADFIDFAKKYGITETNWATVQADITHTLNELAPWHDLAVIEGNTMEVHGLLGVLTDLLWTDRLPCLFLPKDCKVSMPFERIAIGWNGSKQAKHALQAALPFLVNAKEIWILDGTAEEATVNADLPAFDPCHFLAQHGISAKARRIDTNVAIVGSVLLQEAYRFQADLFVLGAFSHSRLRERVAGGVFRCMIENATMPLLMRH